MELSYVVHLAVYTYGYLQEHIAGWFVAMAWTYMAMFHCSVCACRTQSFAILCFGPSSILYLNILYLIYGFVLLDHDDYDEDYD